VGVVLYVDALGPRPPVMPPTVGLVIPPLVGEVIPPVGVLTLYPGVVVVGVVPNGGGGTAPIPIVAGGGGAALIPTVAGGGGAVIIVAGGGVLLVLDPEAYVQLP